MKPNIRSVNFLLSVCAFAAYIVHLFVIRSQITSSLLRESEEFSGSSLYFYLPFIWVNLAGWLFFRSTNKKQSALNQLLAFVIAPAVLLPLVGTIYVIIVLMPIYGLVGQLVR